jgi:purine nucleosidase
VTNLARALEREPDLPRLLKRWVLMGGAYRVPGNTAPTTEWNIHCDPEAAKIAFAAAWPSRPLALGLDVTEKAKITPEHVVALARRAGSTPDDSLALARGEDPMHATRSVASNPIVRYVADALRFYMEFHSRYDGFYGAFIHDPLAVAAALDPSLVTTEAVAVDVELAGTLTSGETVTDWRRVWDRPANLDVAVTADAETFLARLVDRVGRLAAERAQ